MSEEKKASILLVEDEENLHEALKLNLELEGYEVTSAFDGTSALHAIDGAYFDLIVLDIMLPELDGISVIESIRISNNEVPILILSAKNSSADRVLGLKKGADDYLTKPYDFHELLARTRALLRRGHTLKPQILTIADLSIDTRSHQVNRDGKPIDLTAKEYALLEYLARRAGEVVKRAEIAEHVWDDTYDPFSNLIEVYIRRLRRKIDEGFSPKLILTMRGDGYLLSAKEAVDNG